jgi:hypothetical protein
MSTLELIDKAINHCHDCRPNESGHGVTLALLNEIRERVEAKHDALVSSLVYTSKEKDAEIERLKRELEAAKEPKWISVKDSPLFTVDEKGNWECTKNGSKEFMGGLYTNSGFWQGHCIVIDEIGLRLVLDEDNEPCPWELGDIQFYFLLPNPPTE